MTLVDAGPLIALANPRDPDHQACVAAARRIPPPLVTTWAAYTETMYAVYKVLGWPGRSSLMQLVLNGMLAIHQIEPTSMPRLLELMEQYRDRPMDLADATLVVLAEIHGFTRILSLDSDFYIYRLANGRSLEVIP